MKQSADVLADNLQNTPSRSDCPNLLPGAEFYMLFTCTVTVEWEVLHLLHKAAQQEPSIVDGIHGSHKALAFVAKMCLRDHVVIH